MRSSLLLLAAAAAALAIAACSKDGGGQTCNDHSPPASFDPATPAVSFSRDVMPIFKGSCAFSACHGLQGSNNGVFLGESGGPSAVHQNLVDRRSAELPTMSYVTPGDPRQSYLMRKIDGSQCVLDDQCVDKDCGETMPRTDDVLPLETRDVIRRWIAQGAKND